MTMVDPTGTLTVQQWLEAIVDDTSLFTNQIDNNDIVALVRAMEKDAQHWEQYLSASGGCLELSKCFYYILSWTFTVTGDAVPMTTDAINAITTPIQLSEYGKSSSTNIASKHPYEAHKTLGVWKTMTGDTTEQVKILSQRSKNMANIIATSGVHPYQADVAVRMIYTPAMGYSLPAVSIPEKTLDKIQYKALESFVPALGFNKGFPRAVILGPTDYGGENVPHLYTESCIQRLEIFIMHIRGKTTFGKLALINLNWIQHIVGMSTPLFEQPKPITTLTNWYTDLHRFLLGINCKLSITNTHLPTIERCNDTCLMDIITCQNCGLSKNQLRTVHNWRLFFQVQSVSDLANASGDRISDIYLTYPTQPSINLIRTDRTSRLRWPNQPPPTSKASFLLWTKCIRKCFLEPQGTRLRQPLGSWTMTPRSSNSSWTAYIDEHHTSLIIRTHTGFLQYIHVTSQTSRTTTFESSSSSAIASIPLTFFPVDITTSHHRITASHNRNKLAIPFSFPTISPTDINQAISSAPDWQRRLVQHYRIHDLDIFTEALCNISAENSLLMVSDGGLKDDIGSFGVSIGTKTLELCCIEGPVSGNHLTSFRSEAYGMLAGITFLHLFIDSHGISFEQARPIKLYCDNLPLVNWIQKILLGIQYPRMYLKPEADVVLQIQQEITWLYSHNLYFVLDHVTGHQDKHTAYHDLPRPAQLNIAADSYATNYLEQWGPQYEYAQFPNNPITVILNDTIITRKYKHRIRQASIDHHLSGNI